MDRIGVAFDWGTTGITVIVGRYTLSGDGEGNVTEVDTQPAHYYPVELDQGEDNGTNLETVWCLKVADKAGKGSHEVEVLLGKKAREASKKRDGPPLLKYPKFLFLNKAKLAAIAGKDGRALGAQTIQNELSKSFAELARINWDPETLVAAAVRSLWDHKVCAVLDDHFSASNSKKYAKRRAFIDVTITRPSMWKLDDDFKLHSAFKKGLEHDFRVADVRLSDEAHSAITGIMSDRVISDELEVNSVIGLADAGGGTCDVVTHVVRSVEPLRLEEAIPASGGFVGGEILLAQLESDANTLLQGCHDPELHQWQTVLDELVLSFKKSIKSYAGTDSETDIDEEGVWIESLAANWKRMENDETAELVGKGFIVSPGGVGITHLKVQQLFQPYIDKIGTLIVSQIQATEEAAFGKMSLFICVGGFFRNKYLEKGIRKVTRANNIPSSVMRFPRSYPRDTVPKGALRSLADRKVNATRTLQVSIGFQQDLVWNLTDRPGAYIKLRYEHATNRDEDIVYERDNQPAPKGYDKVAYNMVKWLFVKGDRISGPTTRKMRGWRWLKTDITNCKIEEPMYTSSARRRDVEVTFVDDDDSKYAVIDDPENCIEEQFRMKADAFNPRELAHYKSNPDLHDARGYLKIEYEVAATWDGDVFKYVLSIPRSGHFDCANAEDGCPGAKSEKYCLGRRNLQPEQSHIFRLKYKQSLVRAFDMEGTVVRQPTKQSETALTEEPSDTEMQSRFDLDDDPKDDDPKDDDYTEKGTTNHKPAPVKRPTAGRGGLAKRSRSGRHGMGRFHALRQSAPRSSQR